MTDEVKELTLLLLYLTSWKEKNPGGKVDRSWKTYPFAVLDELTEEGLISTSKTAKSVNISEEGKKKAEELKSIYLG